MNEGRRDERLKARVEESACLTYTGFHKREIHEFDGGAHDPDTMVAPLTPKPTRPAEALPRASPTIASRREEDAALRSGHCHGTVVRTAFLKLKQKSEAPQRKPRPYVPTRKSVSRPNGPKPHTHPSHPQTPSHQPRHGHVSDITTVRVRASNTGR
jgi:hypothetical protein